MELSSEEGGEMPMPINSTYGGGHGHMIHHDTAPHSNNNRIPQMPTNGGLIISSSTLDHHYHHHQDTNHHAPSPLPCTITKKNVRYRECLKNHAAAMGGSATDGCGEFMPSGEEGTLEALTCSACNCHRNFHRKEAEGEPSSCDCYHLSTRKIILGHQNHHHRGLLGHESLNFRPRAAPPPHQMIMPYNSNVMMGSIPSESDEQEEVGGVVMARPPHHYHHHHQLVKKRFRTKFTAEQKEKMLQFAEKVGWKIQKQEESVVQQFCQEVGVKRRVLKVWMHNNKHSLAKKNINNNSIVDQTHQV